MYCLSEFCHAVVQEYIFSELLFFIHADFIVKFLNI